MDRNTQKLQYDEIKKLYRQYALKNGYKEVPPTIVDFITDEYYLGKVTQGGKLIYSYWKQVLLKMFPTPFYHINKTKGNPYTDHYIAIYRDAIGVGKTTISSIIFLYDLAHCLCLENPQEYYNLPRSTKIDFLLSNSTKENSETINFANVLGIIRNSPFFLSKLNNETKTSMFINNIDVMAISPQRRSLTGRAVFSVLIDEINRHPRPKEAMAYVTEAINRLPSRFLSEYKGKKYIPGHIFIISSADTDTSLIENIKESLKNDDDKNVIEYPIYESNAKQFEVLKDKINYSDEYFYVFVGTYDQEPKILETETELEYYRKEFPDKIEKVPIDYKLSFKQNLRQAIADILAIPTVSTSNFISDIDILKSIMILDNPCNDIITYDNNVDLINYFNVKKLMEMDKSKEYAIGLDLAYIGDNFGIAMGRISGLIKKDVSPLDIGNKILKMDREVLWEKEIEIVFATSITPLEGQKIKFSNIRKFILDLRNLGFKIDYIYADTFQSYDFITILEDLGFNSKQHSVDKTKIPYYALKNAIYEKSIKLPKSSLLFKEFINLKETDKKIDHPERFFDGTKGSKDIADAVTQCYFCILNEMDYKPFYEKEYRKEIEEIVEEELIKVEMGLDDIISNNPLYDILNDKDKINRINNEMFDIYKPIGE